MTEFLLDSCVCIDVIRGRDPRLAVWIRERKSRSVAISSITYAELLCGVHKTSNIEKNRQALARFLTNLYILPFEAVDAEHYARIRADLERAGQTIGPMDMLIAAHALSLGAILVTSNIREFKRVPGLTIEGWTQP